MKLSAGEKDPVRKADLKQFNKVIMSVDTAMKGSNKIENSTLEVTADVVIRDDIWRSII